MRARDLACLSALIATLPLAAAAAACGGKTPPAKDADDTASSASSSASKSGGGDDSTAAASSGAAGASAAPVATAAPAASTGDSGDIKPTGGDDPWMASHQMAPKDVMKTMKAAQAKVQACWKAGLKRDPSAAGEVKIRFVVTNDGAVRAWRDDGSSMSDGDVTTCVGELVNKLKFPKQKSPGDAWGAYSIHFAP
jgi:hypothetical protein